MAFKCRYCNKSLKKCKCTDYHPFIERCKSDPTKRPFLIIRIWHILKDVHPADRQQFIMFHYNCNKRCMVDYKVCPIHGGGKHETKNLQYLKNSEYREKHGQCPKQIKLKDTKKDYMYWKRKTENLQKSYLKAIRDREK